MSRAELRGFSRFSEIIMGETQEPKAPEAAQRSQALTLRLLLLCLALVGLSQLISRAPEGLFRLDFLFRPEREAGPKPLASKDGGFFIVSAQLRGELAGEPWSAARWTRPARVLNPDDARYAWMVAVEIKFSGEKESNARAWALATIRHQRVIRLRPIRGCDFAQLIGGDPELDGLESFSSDRRTGLRGLLRDKKRQLETAPPR